MKWVTIKNTHINTNNVDAFRWEDGKIVVFFNSEAGPDKCDDPDRKIYLKLCRQLGILPCEEVSHE